MVIGANEVRTVVTYNRLANASSCHKSLKCTKKTVYNEIARQFHMNTSGTHANKYTDTYLHSF